MSVSPSLLEIQSKLCILEEQLNQVQPNIATLLRDIKNHLKSDPDVVTILTEEECAVLIKGLKKQTATELGTSAVKKVTKAASKIGLQDLF